MASYTLSIIQFLRAKGFSVHVSLYGTIQKLECGRLYILKDPPISPRRFSIRGSWRFRNIYIPIARYWLPFKAKLFDRIKKLLQVRGFSLPQRANQSLQVRQSISWSSPCTQPEVRWIRKEIQSRRPDLILANYSWTVPPAKEASPEIPIGLITHDVRHRQVTLRNDLVITNLEENYSKERELFELSLTDFVIAIQSVEKAYLQSLLPTHCIIECPHPVIPKDNTPNSSKTILFVGSNTEANREGLEWFLNYVWPKLKSEIPTIRLLVAGKVKAPQVALNDSQIDLLGFLPSLESAYSTARIAIVPIRRGSGLKIKLVEAIEYGLPSVATSIAAEGIVGSGNAIRVADAPDQFYHHVATLLQNNKAHQAAVEDLKRYRESVLNRNRVFTPLLDVIQDHT